MNPNQDLLREIKAGARELGLATSTLCREAVNNSLLVARMEAGGSVTLRTAERVRRYLRKRGVKKRQNSR
jgi:hypothetical protein